MNITYISNFDAEDIHSWSGLGYHIAKSLEKQGCTIKYINLTSVKKPFHLKVKWVFYKLVGKNYQIYRDPFFAKKYADQVELLLDSTTDIIFSPGSIPIAMLRLNKPIILYTDSTFAGLLNFYDNFKNLAKESISYGNHFEMLALNTCSLAIFSSDWAAETARTYYKIDNKKLTVVPFGANLDNQKNREEITKIIDKKSRAVLKLLFLGVEWDRKGGDIALRITELLNEQNITTELHVAGIKKFDFELPSFVVNHGYISKSDTIGKDQIEKLLTTSHFLLLPTRADCTPVVYSEANSFGLPVLSTNVGGIGTIIKNGVNGMTFSLQATAEDYVKYILEAFPNEILYKSLSISSYDEYTNRLNWETSGKKLVEIMEQVLIKEI
jgi:glycosyltransferase involved in cell wall biosynthesis